MSEERRESAEERREEQTPAGDDPGQSEGNTNPCPECGGSGKIEENVTCPQCGGKGRVPAIGQG